MIPSSTSRWALSSTRKLPIHRDGYWKRVTGSSSYGRREREEGRRLPSPQQFGDVLKRLLNFRRPGRHDQVNLNQLERLRELVIQLEKSPHVTTETLQSGVAQSLLQFKDTGPPNVSQQANMALSLLGYVPPYKGKGLRILAIDGGGTRGLIPIILLQHLERISGLKVYEMFDYVSGTSTGTLLATLMFIEKAPLDEVEKMYRDISKKIFKMNNLLGMGQLFLNQSFYDSSLLEKQVRKFKVTEKKMYEICSDLSAPRMSFVSTLINQPVVQPFLFTNYRHQPNNLSHYLSVPDAQIWKAIMASTAAPGYFEDVQIGSYILQDGGILSNNPAAIALHEARGLWGRDTHIQCLLSLGTGQYAYLQRNDNMVTTNDKHVKQKPSTSLKEKLTKIVASATDTEAVHTILQDVLPSHCYYRLNPLLSEPVALDNCNPAYLQMMVNDTKAYIELRENKLKMAASSLKEQKTFWQKVLIGQGGHWPQ